MFKIADADVSSRDKTIIYDSTSRSTGYEINRSTDVSGDFSISQILSMNRDSFIGLNVSIIVDKYNRVTRLVITR